MSPPVARAVVLPGLCSVLSSWHVVLSTSLAIRALCQQRMPRIASKPRGEAVGAWGRGLIGAAPRAPAPHEKVDI